MAKDTDRVKGAAEVAAKAEAVSGSRMHTVVEFVFSHGRVTTDVGRYLYSEGSAAREYHEQVKEPKGDRIICALLFSDDGRLVAALSDDDIHDEKYAGQG